jgi:murein DD-endopeptidase MepM/ murein hydrolase activator NlpD
LYKSRTYDGRRGSTRRHHSASAYSNNDKAPRGAIKLFICVGLFAVAALIKLLFPSTLTVIGDKINSVVNYKAALTSLGEGISGQKSFTAALGEAFTYAFTGEAVVEKKEDQPSPSNGQATKAASDSAAENDTEQTVPDPAVSAANVTEDAAAAFSEETDGETSETAAADTDSENNVSNAIISAFIQSQEEYSDYAIPAGVTYDMPKINMAYQSPLAGVVSSSFGYRIHPTANTVKFHYGTDIAAKKGKAITAFTDGKVIATGDSSTLGKYVIISHGDIESEYAHCDSVCVTSGQTVKMGDKIATVGDTGNATQTCLHFELKVSGQNVNPEYYVQW